jgi:hypothetical protein
MYLYYLFCAVLFGFNLILLLGGFGLHDCLMFCLFNILCYPFLHLCIVKKSNTKLGYSQFPNLGRIKYIIYECKEVMKHNWLWIFMIFLPFFLGFAKNNDLFIDCTIMDLFIIVAFAFLIGYVCVLSSILNNFYPQNYVVFMILPITILQTYHVFIPNKSDMTFLIFVVGLVLAMYIFGIILVNRVKKRKSPNELAT